jgi:DNA (cytosine-5)-methyltransferase 1
VALHTGVALFAGGGGLELGLSLALGTDYRPVAYVERECTSAAVLAANMERGWLDKAPVWDDVTTFTGDVVSPLVDNIDIVTAGFPCQPWSVAGQRKGTDDERWLWPLIFRLVREIRPRSIFLENVPGLLHGGIEHVLGDLASVGFDAEWTSVRASDVGAPHRRERVFILGITSSSGRSSGSDREREHEVRDNGNGSPSEDQQLRGVGQSGASEGSEALADTDHGDRGQRDTGTEVSERAVNRPAISERGVDDSDNQGLQRWGRYSRRGDEWLAWPPGPSDYDAWERVDERFYPAKPDVRGVANGLARGLARADKLRILGNGVVPQQAALAFTLLHDRMENTG